MKSLTDTLLVSIDLSASEKQCRIDCRTKETKSVCGNRECF